MLSNRLATLTAYTFLFLGQSAFAQKANTFDCSVIYDEYDSLMYNQYIQNIQDYVAYTEKTYTEALFDSEQKGKLKLNPDHQDQAIAIFQTNQNLYGKMRFRFSKHFVPIQAVTSEQEANPTEPTPTITIEEIIIFQRINDGFEPIQFGPMVIQKDYIFDIDGFGYYPMVDQTTVKKNSKSVIRGDFVIIMEDGELSINATEGTKLYFPSESLCAL